MRSSLSIPVYACLLLGLGGADLLPKHARSDNADAVAARADPKPPAGAASPPAGQPAGVEPAGTHDAFCAQGAILALGIAANIADQEQELATAQKLEKILGGSPFDSAAYSASRVDLLKFINNGIAIREMAQIITPAGNPAIPGIAIVANAQLEELGLGNNLTLAGSDDIAGNTKITQTLQKDFSGGIQQNKKNMAAATAGCDNKKATPAGAASAAAASPGPKVKDAGSPPKGKADGGSKARRALVRRRES